MDEEAVTTEKKASVGKVTAMAIGMVLGWAGSVFLSFMSGASVAIMGGMKPGGWDIHLIYPMILSGLVALITYPLIYGVVRVISKNYGAAVATAIVMSISLGSMAAFIMGRSV